MAEKLHLVHVKSNVYGKAPSASTINYGEIAVNYNTNTPALYIRDSADKIVKFIAEPYFLKIVGTGVTENDGYTITPISEIIQQDEETISAAFNDINDRKADKSYVDEAVSSITIDVDSELDSASTNPVENRAIYKAIVDDEKAIAAAINDLNDRKADISYVDDAITSITIDVDSVLDSASTNPLENRAIYQILEEDEIAISAALNDLNDRKADKEYVDEAISGVTIDALDYIDSASTMPVESQAIWHRFDEDEHITAYALNDLNTRLLGCESGLTTELSSDSTDAEWPTAKATYDEIHPKKENSVPAGGLYPNVYYNLGVLSGNTTISFATPFDQTVENEYRFRFTAATPAPTIIWPNSITKWAGNRLDYTTKTPIITDGTMYEVSALDGLAIIIAYE